MQMQKEKNTFFSSKPFFFVKNISFSNLYSNLLIRLIGVICEPNNSFNSRNSPFYKLSLIVFNCWPQK